MLVAVFVQEGPLLCAGLAVHIHSRYDAQNMSACCCFPRVISEVRPACPSLWFAVALAFMSSTVSSCTLSK